MKKTQRVIEHFDGTIIIVIGFNNYWGKGETLEEALKNAQRPAKYKAYIAAAATYVSEFDGGLCYKSGFKPRLISSKGVK